MLDSIYRVDLDNEGFLGHRSLISLKQDYHVESIPQFESKVETLTV
jgi:hypothetical protein